MTPCPSLWLLTGAVLLVGCASGSSPKNDADAKPNQVVTGDAKEKPKKAFFAPVTTVVRPELASKTPDFVIHANVLKKEWRDNSDAAKQKYDGKIVEITGYVDQVTTTSVIVCASPHRYSNTYVAHCMAPADKVQRIHRLGNGQKVKVLTKNISMGVIVDLISLTELEPSNLIEITAEDLAKEFEKAPMAAEQKYKDRDLAVSGRIKAFTKDELSCQAVLFGAGQTSVRVLAADQAAKWEGKKEVQVRITFAAYVADRREVEAWGFVMDPK
jgi:tRNA_anti-like